MASTVRTRAVPSDPSGPNSAPASRGVDDPLYPVGLVVRGRRCLVVGGGAVAARKIRSLLQCGALVTMVAPDVSEAVRALLTDETTKAMVGDRLDVQRRRYERGEVVGYRLVVAATGVPHVDAAVYEDAEVAGVWVNSADDPAHCSVVLPAVWRTGVVTVSVSTSGTSPALAAWIRARVAESLGAHVGSLARLLGETGRSVQDAGRRTDSVDWSAILDGPVPGLVADGRLAEARAALDAAAGVRRTPPA
jgi:siroheme synthase-like protein